jgi:phosphoadenosine phosphosulfate reductase
MKEGLVKIEEAKKIINAALSMAKVPFVEFTGGKDSLVALHLVREMSRGSFSTIFIDTSAHFSEVYHFVEKMRKLWNLRLVIEKTPEAMNRITIGEDKEKCCDQLKRKVLRDSIKKHGIDYLFTGLNMEDGVGKDPQDISSSKEEYWEVHPIVDFSESEVWEYIKKANLPYCSLYDKGYKHIDCIPCTETTGAKPRSPMEEDAQEIMKKLKQLGYV